MKKIGEGRSCSSNSEALGEFVYIQSVEDVINIFDDANGKICIVDDAGTTTLGPILSDLAGVLCPFGSAGSHLAIVSRIRNTLYNGCRIFSRRLVIIERQKG